MSAFALSLEISIVFGAFLGVRLFGEPAGARRVVAAALMFAGIVGIAASA